ncbi:uncharacterized protein BJX67DRAFT_378198 [Aspergillus lucknowensis]|uniref:DinB-like domain-containing protein n=1 Tax=Aspergillus lucknowensis TaxID=176173 RepID=A0ABR4M2U2_9EURO
MEEMNEEDAFRRKYCGRFILRRPDYHQLMGCANSLITQGAAEWGFDPDGLGNFYWEMYTLARAGSAYNWTGPGRILPPTAASHFGDVLAELLIHITVHERLFQNPFWYLDGKTGPDDTVGDTEFGHELTYMFERFYKGDQYDLRGTLAKADPTFSQLRERHHAPNTEFGKYNADRHEKAVNRLILTSSS